MSSYLKRRMNALIGAFIGLMVVILVAVSAVIPAVTTAIAAANLTGSTATIVGLLPLLLGVALVLAVVGVYGNQ